MSETAAITLTEDEVRTVLRISTERVEKYGKWLNQDEEDLLARLLAALPETGENDA